MMVTQFYRFITLFILVTCVNSYSQDDQPVIGVLGLENQGGLSDLVVDTICNRISELIDQTQKYLVLQREFIPPTLEAQGLMVSPMMCSQKEGLAAAGNLLSAQELIGGTIKREGGVFTLDVMRIKVVNRQLLSSQKIVSTGTKQDILNVELPKLVDKLLKDTPVDDAPVSTKTVVKEKKRSKAPLAVLLGTLTAGGIAAGTFAVIEATKTDSRNDVPLDGLPERVR